MLEQLGQYLLGKLFGQQSRPSSALRIVLTRSGWAMTSCLESAAQ